MRTLNLNFEGYRPREHQRAVHKLILGQKDRIVCVRSRRQVGKTTMAENILLWFGINQYPTTSMLISITLAQSRKVFKDIVNAIEMTGIIKKKNEQTLEITLKNGSQILFKSSEQGTESLRGYTISGVLILDEASFLSEDILQAVLPFCNVHRAPILIISTPKFKNCFFYRFFMKGLNGDKGYYSVDWNEYDLSEFLSEDKLKEFEQILPKNQFKTEFLGEFLDDDGVVFGNFKSCIAKDVKKRSYKGKRIVVGIDWSSGTGNDNTSITLLDEDGNEIDLIAFNNLNTTDTIDRIVDILKSIERLEFVLCENNSIGTPMTELLIKALPNVKIEGVTTTNNSKAEMVSELQVKLEKNQISLLDIPEQTNEIASYEAVYNPRTKNVAYNAPTGLHDDRVMSLMIAVKALGLINKRGKYYIR